jgi:hypothetical protein
MVGLIYRKGLCDGDSDLWTFLKCKNEVTIRRSEMDGQRVPWECHHVELKAVVDGMVKC